MRTGNVGGCRFGYESAILRPFIRWYPLLLLLLLLLHIYKPLLLPSRAYEEYNDDPRSIFGFSGCEIQKKNARRAHGATGTSLDFRYKNGNVHLPKFRVIWFKHTSPFFYNKTTVFFSQILIFNNKFIIFSWNFLMLHIHYLN
jgi:hypothetical protein